MIKGPPTGRRSERCVPISLDMGGVVKVKCHDIREGDSHLTSHSPSPTMVMGVAAPEKLGPPGVNTF